MEANLIIDNNLTKSYLKLTIPVILSMVVSMVYHLADTYFIALTHNTALVAGVALCAPLFTIQMAFGNIFAQGGCSLMSRLLGADKLEDIKHVSAFCILSGYITGIVLGVVFLAFGQWILPILGADAETIVYAQSYYRWCVIGSPVVVASFSYTNLFRAEGLSTEAMWGSAIGVIINMALDPIFILVLGMGAKGAAIATVIGYIISNLYCIYVLRKKSKLLFMHPRYVGISRDYTKQIFGIGIPAGIMNIAQSISVIFLNQFLLPYGHVEIAAMGIAMRAVSIVNFVLIAMAYGGQPIFGYLIGAKDNKRLMELFRINVRAIATVAILLTVVVFAFAPGLIRVIMNEPQIVTAGAMMLRLQVITMTVAGLVLLFTLLFQSSGKIGISFVLNVSRQGFVFLIVLFILSRVFGYYGVLVTQAVADIASFVLAFVLLRKFILRVWKQ